MKLGGDETKFPLYTWLVWYRQMQSESLMKCRMKYQFSSMQGHNSHSDHEIINHVLLDMLSRFRWVLTQFNIHGSRIMNCCDSWGLLAPRCTRTHVWTCMSYFLLQYVIWIQPTNQSCFLKSWQVVKTFYSYKNCSAHRNILWHGENVWLHDTVQQVAWRKASQSWPISLYCVMSDMYRFKQTIPGLTPTVWVL